MLMPWRSSMVLAGHRSQGLVAAGNITLLKLPP
jgi:hypothetical protein